MGPHANQTVLALLCDPLGVVYKVLRDDFGITEKVEREHLWIGLIDQANLVSALNFTHEIVEKGAVYDWELSIILDDQVVPLHFAGGKVNEMILIVGSTGATPMRFYEEEMSKILTNFGNLIREQMQKPAGSDHAYLVEVARLNDELIKMQQDLSKTVNELSEKQRFIQHIFDTAPNVLLIYDLADQRTVYANREIVAILGYTPVEIQQMGPSFMRQLIHPTDAQLLEDHHKRFETLPDGQILEVEYRLRDSTGGWRWINSRDTVFLRDAQGKPHQILSIAQDITDRKKVQEELWFLSTHDALTGLYNRGYFYEEMGRIEKMRSFPISILIADLDDLKRTNDTLGHTAGDDLLRRTADTLRSCFRPGEVIARVGGDEFAVLIEHASATTAQAILERVKRIVAMESYGREGAPLGVSVGIATAETPQPLLEVYKEADSQMYSDKINRKQTGQLRGRS